MKKGGDERIMLRGRKSKNMPDRNIGDGRKRKERQEESDLMRGPLCSFSFSFFIILVCPSTQNTYFLMT